MDLFEYQARELFDAHGVPVLNAEMARTPDEALAAARRIGLPVVVKAQVKTGGRGKAGGVKVATTEAELVAAATAILGMDIKGHTVHVVMIAPAVDILAEYYVSILLDRASGGYVALASAQGGMEIEELAQTRPEALAKIPIDARTGLDQLVVGEITASAGFPQEVSEAVGDIIAALWDVFTKEDATLVEVNPLALIGTGDVAALDGKVTLDDNAAFRHPDRERFADAASDDPLEAAAKAKGLNYVKLDGQVGVIGNGAGLVMSTLDVVAGAGQAKGVRPANFLDIGGGASAEVMSNALEIVLGDPQVKAVLVNVFGGITACDEVARGIVTALKQVAGDGRPLVVRLDGNAVEEGRRILADAGLAGVRMADTMDGAAALVADLAAGA